MERISKPDHVEEVPALTHESLRLAETLTEPQRHEHIQQWASSIDANCTDDSHGHEMGSQAHPITSPTSHTATTATTANTTPDQHPGRNDKRQGVHKAPRSPGHQNNAQGEMKGPSTDAGQPTYRSGNHKHSRHRPRGGRMQRVHVRVFAPRVLDSQNLTYTIELETHSSAFKHHHCRVDRRYSHCRWLWQCLGTKTPFPAPISRPNLESLQEHDRQLQGIKHFLARVANIPKYQRRRALQDFFSPDIDIDRWDWLTDLAAPLPPEAASRNDAGTTGVRSNRFSSTSTLGSTDPVPHVFSPTPSTPSKQRHRSPAKASALHDDTSTDGSHRTVYDNYVQATSASSSRLGDVSTEDVHHSEEGRAVEQRPRHRPHRSRRHRRRHHHRTHKHHSSHHHGQQHQQPRLKAPAAPSAAREDSANTGDGEDFASAGSLAIASPHYHQQQQQHRQHRPRHDGDEARTSAAARVVRPETPPIEQPVIEDQDVTPHRPSRVYQATAGEAHGIPVNTAGRSGGGDYRGQTGGSTQQQKRHAEHTYRSHDGRIRREQVRAAVADASGDANDTAADSGHGDHADIHQRPPVASGGERWQSEQRLPPRPRVAQWWIPLDGVERSDSLENTAHQNHQRPQQYHHHNHRPNHEQQQQQQNHSAQISPAAVQDRQCGRSGATWTIPFTPQGGSSPQRQHCHRHHRSHQQREQREQQHGDHYGQPREHAREPISPHNGGAGTRGPHRQDTRTTDPLRFTAVHSPQRQKQKNNVDTVPDRPARELHDSVQWLQLDASCIDATFRS